MSHQSGAAGLPALQLAYERAGNSYEAITEFRAKLLTLLPLATGTGAFLLLEHVQGPKGDQFRGFLGPIGLFSAVVTLGLFTYELRGMQRCHRLEVQAATLERQLGLSPEEGPFRGQPRRALGNMLGPPAAGLIIYLATVFAWLRLAGYGFYWKIGLGWWRKTYDVWGLLFAYVAVLVMAWVLLSWWLRRSATGGLPKIWKRFRVEMPPMKPGWASDSGLREAREKVRAEAWRQAFAPEPHWAELDWVEFEYLKRLYETLVYRRTRVAARNPHHYSTRR